MYGGILTHARKQEDKQRLTYKKQQLPTTLRTNCTVYALITHATSGEHGDMVVVMSVHVWWGDEVYEMY